MPPRNVEAAIRTERRQFRAKADKDAIVPFDWIGDEAPAIDPEVEATYLSYRGAHKIWADEVQEYAYQVWAYIAGRNATRTALFIRNPPSETDMLGQVFDFATLPPLDVPASTIRAWANTQAWETRVALEFKAMAPDSWEAIRRNLMDAALHGSEHLKRVMAGLEDTTREKMGGLQMALDRIGMTPYIQPNTNNAPRGPKRENSVSLADATNEQILDRIRELAQAQSTTLPIADAAFQELPTDTPE